MKKLLLIMVAMFGFLSCENPSIENGLANLETSLAELEASFVALDIEQMQTDLIAMNEMAADMVVTAEENRVALEEALVTVASILEGLENVRINLEEAATVEQVQNIRAQVAEISEGIAMLVFIADYDYDGVMNGLDQCPDTPLSDINNVNGVGCAPGQTPVTGTTTTTTGD